MFMFAKLTPWQIDSKGSVTSMQTI